MLRKLNSLVRQWESESSVPQRQRQSAWQIAHLLLGDVICRQLLSHRIIISVLKLKGKHDFLGHFELNLAALEPP